VSRKNNRQQTSTRKRSPGRPKVRANPKSLACPICASVRSAPLGGPQNEWRYLQCTDCRHAWLVPTPDEQALRTHYNSAYQVPRAAYFGTVNREFPALRRKVERLTAGRKMLEIGCSYGGMLARFAGVGWKVEGVELDHRAVEVASNELSLHVEAGTIEDVAVKLSPPYDVITAYHVIEHVTDPAAFLSQIRTLLTADGILVLRLPNGSSAVAQLTRGWWEWFIAPEHVNVFSPRSISTLLQQEGFTVISQTSRRGDGNRLLFEAAKTVGRWGYRSLVRRNADDAHLRSKRSTSPSDTSAYQVVRGALNVLGAPLDWAIGLADRVGLRSMPEMIIFTRRAER
jgi:2-polyprenyl-3-methyl-5-hydroxy-6-metoxy-1,4-benzoquinol methylase